MLEADAVQRVGELDVDAQVVAVELELVARRERLVLGDVERERGDRALAGEFPVVVAVGLGLEGDHVFTRERSWARLERAVLPEVFTV